MHVLITTKNKTHPDFSKKKTGKGIPEEVTLIFLGGNSKEKRERERKREREGLTKVKEMSHNLISDN